MEKNFKMLAKTFYGFEEILEKELRKLGAQNIKKETVSFPLREIKVLCIKQTCLCVRY
jgi:23S rRNA G2445 N2-methylase RlmL